MNIFCVLLMVLSLNSSNCYLNVWTPSDYLVQSEETQRALAEQMESEEGSGEEGSGEEGSGEEGSGDDVSGDDAFDISESFEYFANDFEEDDTTFFEHLDRTWSMVNESWESFFDRVKSQWRTAVDFYYLMDNLRYDLQNMRMNQNYGGMNFNPIISSIRWFVGDTVFYELYVLLMAGYVFVLLKIFNFGFKAVLSIIRAISSIGTKGIGRLAGLTKVTQWFSGLFH